MNTNLTEIACVVDRSGSMGRIRQDAIGGFNTFLEAQQAEPGEARLTLVLFNHDYTCVCSGEDLQGAEVQEDATQDLLDAGESPECPECGNMTLYFSEGCKTCESCGWSEC